MWPRLVFNIWAQAILLPQVPLCLHSLICILFYVYVCFGCIYVHAPCVCLVPTESPELEGQAVLSGPSGRTSTLNC